MNTSPRSMRCRSTFESLKTPSTPGSPRDAPVMQISTGSLRTLAAGVNLKSLVHELHKKLAEFIVAAGSRCPRSGRRGCRLFDSVGRRRRRCGNGSGRCGRSGHRPVLTSFRHRLFFGFAETEPGGIQAAEREVERCGIADSRVVGK